MKVSCVVAQGHNRGENLDDVSEAIGYRSVRAEQATAPRQIPVVSGGLFINVKQFRHCR